MSSTSVHSTATMKYWKKKTNAISDTGRKELVQVALLQIQGEDGAYLLVLLGSLIGVSSVHFCLMCSVWKTNFSYIFRTLQALDNRSGLPVPIDPSRCTSPRSSQFWVANRSMLNLSLEAIVNSFKLLFDTSPLRIVGYEMLHLCFSFAVPSTTRSPLFNDVVRDWESIQSPLVKMFAGFAFLQEMSTSAMD